MPVATTAELGALIGRFGRINLAGLDIDVSIEDSRVRFGHVDALIKPCSGGDAAIWVEASRITLNN